MTTTLLWLLVVLLIGAGLAGTVLPMLPGTALVLLGIVLGAWIDDFSHVGAGTLAVVAVLACWPGCWSTSPACSAHSAPAPAGWRCGARRWARSSACSWGWSACSHALAGAAAGEYLARRADAGAHGQALKVGVATWLGIMAGLLAKVVIAFMMIGIFVAALLI